MRYIGSKRKLLDWIFSFIPKPDKPQVFLDGCAGSGCVARYAAKQGFKVISNDLLWFSSYLVRGSTSLTSEITKEASKHIAVMNTLPGVQGFFYKNYSPAGNRMFLTEDNAAKIDACRQYIEAIDGDVHHYLMYCLLEALSRVLNTTGIQMSFLKTWQSNATKLLDVKQEEAFYAPDIETYSEDIHHLLNERPFEKTLGTESILYVDPPYNTRSYAANFHLFESLVRYDNPTIKGVGGIRPWKQEADSLFCSASSCLSFLEDVLKATKASMILLSYNSDGLMSLSQLEECFVKLFPNARLSIHVMPYKRYKADSSDTRTYDTSALREYLFQVVR